MKIEVGDEFTVYGMTVTIESIMFCEGGEAKPMVEIKGFINGKAKDGE